MQRRVILRCARASPTKSPGIAAGASSRHVCILRLFERSRNGAERGVQLGAEALNDGDDRNRDAGRDETIFDGRGARLVLYKTRNKLFH
jgi:hypothetical protein